MAYSDLSIISGEIIRTRGKAVLWQSATQITGTWVAGWFGTAEAGSGPVYGIWSGDTALQARIGGSYKGSSLQFFAGQPYQFCLILDTAGCRLLMRGAWDYKEWIEVWMESAGTGNVYFGHNAVTCNVLVDTIIIPAENLGSLLTGSIGTRLDPYISPPPVSTIYVIDNSVVPNSYSAFPALVQLLDGTLICHYYNATDHGGSGNAIIQQRKSADGGLTWGAATTVYDDATWPVRGAGLARLSSGDLVATLATDERPSSPSYKSWCVISSDDGATWGTPIEIASTILTDGRFVQMPIIELGNGNLLVALYGQESGETDDTCVCLVSTDQGATWGSEVKIADGPTDNINYTEPNLVLLDNGTVLCLIRDLNNKIIKKCTSGDGGATWSGITDAFTGNGQPYVIQLSDARLLATTRQAVDSTAVYRLSSDRGATWGDEVSIHNFERYTMEYACPVELPSGKIGMAYGVQSNLYTNDSDVLYREIEI